ncbi:MAG: protoheme IX farnesyltransferase [Chloroflexi bacterium]|nr:protoheme IX farnesyltransferase [Chloroflexota bacterium]
MTEPTTTALTEGKVPLWRRLRAYWQMTKSLQTGLLLVTGLAGYASAGQAERLWPTIAAVLGSLFLAVAGSTVLNMALDRDIDARMARTAKRPLPRATVGPQEAWVLGLAMAVLGVSWGAWLHPLTGAVIFAGVFLDVVVYTVWLKRRTPWSILWGGISGGMPVLAGRTLAVGQIDGIGLLLALAVLAWIPTHIMTFSIKYAEDYGRAGVPVFPNVYGVRATRFIIGISTSVATLVMLWATWLTGLGGVYMSIAVFLGAMLLVFALASVVHATPKLNFVLFKLASLYMLGSMFLIISGL